MQNIDIIEKMGLLENINIYYHIKMCIETLMSGRTEIEKAISSHYKSPIFLEDKEINNVLKFSKIFSDENKYKYVIGYLDNDYKIKQLHIMLAKVST